MPPPRTPDQDETRQTLFELSRRSFGAFPGAEVVEHVLAFTPGADFPVQAAAVEALVRRWQFARRDGLVVSARPKGGRVFGVYATGRSSGGRGKRTQTPDRRNRRAGDPRPYATVLEALSPPRGNCDCPDFIRSSLGLCKHLLVVLDDVYANPRRRAAGSSEVASRTKRLKLAWDPGVPLTGSIDRLLGLELVDADGGAGRGAGKEERFQRLFVKGRLDARKLRTPAARSEVLVSLEAAMQGRTGGLDATPAARAIVRDELDRAMRRVENGSAVRETLRYARTLKRKLYPYQMEGLTRFLEAGRLLLADDMGLGKTTQAIAAAHALFESGRIRRGLLVVPAALKSQWLREWEQTSDVPATVVEGIPEERRDQYRKLHAGFLIVGYEQLLRDIEHIHRLSPEFVVLDEAQRIKNYATKSAVYVKSLDPRFRLVLTGTPMENRLEELASILDWVDDLALAPKWRLVPWHTSWSGDASAGGRAGARNLDTLRARFAPCVVRRVRREVLAQLPSRTDTRVPVEMTPQQRSEHDDLNDPIARLIATSKRRPLTQPEFLRLMALLTQQRIISNGLGQLRFEEMWSAYKNAAPDPALIDGLFAPKLGELRRLVQDLVVEQGRKVVVFSQWRRMLRLAEWSLRDVLGRTGARAAFFTGAERPAQRTRSIVDFHDDPAVSILFLSDAGGVGLNLQRAANACINLELPWNPAVLEQRIGRIYRLGQKDPIDVYNLVSEYGIEARIANVVGTKQALFSGLFDGTSDEIQFQGSASFLSSVERLVQIDAMPEAPPALDADDAAGDDEVPVTSEAATATAKAEGALADDLAAPSSPPAPARLPPPNDAADAESGSSPGVPRALWSPGSLFGRLRIERTANGGVRIDAPPEAAEQLMELFSGMARLLGEFAGPRSEKEEP